MMEFQTAESRGSEGKAARVAAGFFRAAALPRRRDHWVARVPWLIYECVAFYVILFLFGVGGLAVSLCAVILYPLLPRTMRAPIGRTMIMTGFGWLIAVLRVCGLVKCDLSALDSMRREEGLIIAPNHPSLLDAVLILSRLPGLVCITKAPIWDNLFLGGGARLAGYIRNDQPKDLIKSSTEAVSAGNSLLIFPEGTRTTQKPVNAFKGGFALIAKRAHAPVQTVFIDCSSSAFGKGWHILKKPAFPLTYQFRLGRRFEVGDDLRGSVRELEAYYRAELGTKDSGVKTAS